MLSDADAHEELGNAAEDAGGSDNDEHDEVEELLWDAVMRPSELELEELPPPLRARMMNTETNFRAKSTEFAKKHNIYEDIKNYEPVHPVGEDEPEINLPFLYASIGGQKGDADMTPKDFYTVFITEELVQKWTAYTNAYIDFRRALPPQHRDRLARERRSEEGVVLEWEVWMFLAMLMHMGTTRTQRIESYFERDNMSFCRAFLPMRWRRFKFIRRNIKIESHAKEDKNGYPRHMRKVASFFKHLNHISMQLVEPRSRVALDEVVIRMFGRAAERKRYQRKPIKIGQELLAVACRSYIFCFLPSGGHAANYLQDTYPILSCITSRMCALLVDRLSTRNKQTTVFADNRFSELKLVAYLRSRGVGWTGTVNANRIDPLFKPVVEDILSDKVPWGDIFQKAHTVNVFGEDHGVLESVWCDQNAVRMMTTVHEATSTGGGTYKLRNRKRPSSSSTRASILNLFDDAARKVLPVPLLAHDYNNYMNYVDSADQVRAYYTPKQFKSRRNWMPQFVFGLDMAFVNAYKASIFWCEQTRRRPWKSHIFRKDVTAYLFRMATNRRLGARHGKDSRLKHVTVRQFHVTADWVPPQERFAHAAHFPIQIHPGAGQKRSRTLCALCRLRSERYKVRAPRDEPGKKPGKPCKVTTMCSHCHVGLCTKTRGDGKMPCFQAYHQSPRGDL